MAALTAGTTLAERYRLVRRLGQGGMGEVWSATHLLTGKLVAIKALKPERATRPDLVRRLFREARAATAVNHPNVIQVHDVFLQGESPIMVMDLLEGESLAARLERDKRLSLEQLATLLVPVISAVGTAHARGIVHRDLKPENVFLARGAAGGSEPRVLDFGIAKLALPEGQATDAVALTRTGSMLGTPFYMAPEQAAGEHGFDHRCDVWALGVICYEALSGRRPFEGENFGQVFKRIITQDPTPLSELCPALPAPVVDLLARMLHREPLERATLAEAMRVLSTYAASSAPPFGEPLSESQAAAGLGRAAAAEPAGAAETLEEEPPRFGTLAAATATIDQADRGRWLAGRVWTRAALLLLGLTMVGVAASWWMPRGTSSARATPPASAAAAGLAGGVASSPSTAPALGSASPLSGVPVPAYSGSAPVGTSKPTKSRPSPKQLPPPQPTGEVRRLPGGILDQQSAPF